MGKIVLVTGGCRSGKSAHAQALGEAIGRVGETPAIRTPAIPRRVYIATCPVLDEEMRRRIERHKADRADRWETIEETLDLPAAIAQAGAAAVILVDCLTLWVNNLMYAAGQDGRPSGEDDVARQCQTVLETCRRQVATVIFVTNEVGMGIVPDNAAARLYRDLVGRANQTMAAGADEVRLVVSGLPVILKASRQRGKKKT